MKTITSTPVDFDRWMQNHGPKKDQPAPAPAPTARRGTYDGDPIPGPAVGGSWTHDRDGDPEMGDDDYLNYPCADAGWKIQINRHADNGSLGDGTVYWIWGFVAPDFALVNDAGNEMERFDGGASKATARRQATDWLRSHGVPEPTDAEWKQIGL